MCFILSVVTVTRADFGCEFCAARRLRYAVFLVSTGLDVFYKESSIYVNAKHSARHCKAFPFMEMSQRHIHKYARRKETPVGIHEATAYLCDPLSVYARSRVCLKGREKQFRCDILCMTCHSFQKKKGRKENISRN